MTNLGEKTKKNLEEAFAGESMARINMITMLVSLKKQAMSKSLIFLKKQPRMKKSMLSFGQNI